MAITGITDGSGRVASDPWAEETSDSGGETRDTTNLGDLANDIRDDGTEWDQPIEESASGADTNDITVTDQDGGSSNGGTTVIDPDTSADSTGDQVAVQESGGSTQVVTEDGEQASMEHPTSMTTGESSDSSGGAEALASTPSKKAGAVLLALAVLARWG